MTNGVVGLWLNKVPAIILNNDDTLQELSGLIFQEYRPWKMVVADNALLITMEKHNCLPAKFIGTVARNLRSFMLRKQIPTEEIEGITLSTYDNHEKWKKIKEQITAVINARRSVRSEKWDNKHIENWYSEDVLQWLREMNLGQYIKSFKENDIDGHNLLELNDTDLRDLGLNSPDHRQKFKRNLSEAKSLLCDSEDGSVNEDSYNETENRKPQPFFKCVVVRGLPQSLLEDEDTMFDIENHVFSVYSMDKFAVRDNGIIVTFDSPLTAPECDDLKEKFMAVLKGLMLDSKLDGKLTIDLWEDGVMVDLQKINEENVDEGHVKKRQPPGTINYWKDFWIKIQKNGDPEDFFPNGVCRLNIRDAREVLATIRDVKMREIKKNDPGIKHLKGLNRLELKKAFSSCLPSVKEEIEDKIREVSCINKLEVDTIPKKAICVGISVEGLPRFITDDDNTVRGIQRLVFRDVPVRRMVVLEDQNPAALRVEFEEPIASDKIPMIGRNLKTFLKAVNVNEEALNKVSIVFLEGVEKSRVVRKDDSGYRSESEDFLVTPGDELEFNCQRIANSLIQDCQGLFMVQM
jgi:hypothetical protein